MANRACPSVLFLSLMLPRNGKLLILIRMPKYRHTIDPVYPYEEFKFLFVCFFAIAED